MSLASGLLVLEVGQTGRSAIRFLSHDDSIWNNTLQFRNGDTRYVCFRYAGQRLRRLRSFDGIKIHAANGSLLPIPPTVFSSGDCLTYLDPGARLAATPNWLIEGGREPLETEDGIDNSLAA
jgi:hypothetical protein